VKSSFGIWLAVVLIAGLAAAVLRVVGNPEWRTALLIMLLATVVAGLASALPVPRDEAWLPGMIMLGYLAKILGAFARNFTLFAFYGGSGDARGYHGSGIRGNDYLRQFQLPPDTGTAGSGTEFVDLVTGLLYVPYEPTFLGGFVLFATLAFIGQLLIYLAFRNTTAPERWKLFALSVFFLPTLVFWPSSPGKEALMMLFIGIATFGAAKLFAEYRIRWLFVIGAGLAGTSAIRVHVSLLIMGAIGVVLLFARSPSVPGARIRRLGLLSIAGVGLAALVFVASSQFQIDLRAGVSEELLTEEVDPFLDKVTSRTEQGGSEVEGGFIEGPEDIPEATLRVLFRPLPYEANNLPALAASAEGTILLLLFIWRSPAILRNLRRVRGEPFALYSVAFTFAFVIGWSSMVNLGILARQRSQTMAFLMAVLVILGAKPVRQKAPVPAVSAVPAAPRRRPVTAP